MRIFIYIIDVLMEVYDVDFFISTGGKALSRLTPFRPCGRISTNVSNPENPVLNPRF